MSSITTLKVYVFGDNFEELVEKAEDEIASLLVIPVEDVYHKARYELFVTRDDDMGADFAYKAEVIARIKV